MMRRHASDHERGATAAEFGLVVPVFLVVVGAIVTLGLHAYYSSVAEHVARRSARYASIRTSAGATAPYPTPAQVTSYAAGKHPGLSSAPTVATSVQKRTPTDADGAGDVVTVSVTYDVGFLRTVAGLLPFDATGLYTITRSAQARRE